MKGLISIDPGVRRCGVALFVDERLVRAGLVSLTAAAAEEGDAECCNALAGAVTGFPGRIPYLTDIVVEFPKVYPAAQQKGDQNDLLRLAAVAGACMTRVTVFGERRFVFPREWKGTIDPDAFIERRIKPALAAEEHARIELPSAKSLSHNVYDAIGIGLWALGRLEPKRVFPR